MCSWSSAPEYVERKTDSRSSKGETKSNKAKLTRSDKLKTKSDNAKNVMIKKIEDVSREAMMEKCGCKKFCLSTVGDTIAESLSMLVDYMTPWMAMKQSEHREKFFPILEGCALGVTTGGHLDKR